MQTALPEAKKPAVRARKTSSNGPKAASKSVPIPPAESELAAQIIEKWLTDEPKFDEGDAQRR